MKPIDLENKICKSVVSRILLWNVKCWLDEFLLISIIKMSTVCCQMIVTQYTNNYLVSSLSTNVRTEEQKLSMVERYYR